MKLSKIAKQLGSKGGKQSVKIRFNGKSKNEISEIMKRVRKSSKKTTTSSQDLVDCLNLSVQEQKD